MKAFFPLIALIAVVLCCPRSQAVDHFVSPVGASVAPFLTWDTAATNIQDAIDAAAAGDVVWVTNGTYSAGGKVMAGDLTNRVALDKALTVQSINGPLLTTVQGAWDPITTNGPLAVRCAWLTNKAVLSGFTLEGGATRGVGAVTWQQSGGGVWASSNNAVLVNCLLRGNAAYAYGGGAAQAGLFGCTLAANTVTGTGSYGGGADHCNLTNCLILGNVSVRYGGGASYGLLRNCFIANNLAYQGGGVENATLYNCTLVSNVVASSTTGYITPTGGGADASRLTNCILFANRALGSFASGANYNSGLLSWCCTTPMPPGISNITADPQLLADGLHIMPTSPCYGAGLSAAASGGDIDGQTWAATPSIGCDEWSPAPACTLPVQHSLSGFPPSLVLSSLPVGQAPLSYWWYKDGLLLDDSPKYGSTHGSNLTVNAFGPADAGSYQLLASNAFGLCTSALAQIVVHCADPAGTAPLAPYADWTTAATNLQDAVDAAGWGELVLATNGVYATGGRVMSGDLTNRVAIVGAKLVSSVNGPTSAVLLGVRDPVSGTGPLAVRCALLNQGSTLRGFTLQNGATRSIADDTVVDGGAAWCGSTNDLLYRCVLTNSTAYNLGGGCYQGQLHSCVIAGNTAFQGGGVAYAGLITSALFSNSVPQSGGGAYNSTLWNCSVTLNTAFPHSGGGVYGCAATNCIIFKNRSTLSFDTSPNDWDLASRSLLFSCWTTTNSSDYSTPSPQLVFDNIHLSAVSPCRGAGNALYLPATDIDGEPWLNPPSIGCDEYYAADFTGPLALAPVTVRGVWTLGPVLRNGMAVAYSSLSGNADRLEWSFGDGTIATNAFSWVANHAWTNAGDFLVTFTAYNADNPAGVSTNTMVHVALPDPPMMSSLSLTGTTFSFAFRMQGGVRYAVDAATNLVQPTLWQTIGTFVNYAYPISTGLISDVNATNPMRFYRVRAQ